MKKRRENEAIEARSQSSGGGEGVLRLDGGINEIF